MTYTITPVKEGSDSEKSPSCTPQKAHVMTNSTKIIIKNSQILRKLAVPTFGHEGRVILKLILPYKSSQGSLNHIHILSFPSTANEKQINVTFQLDKTYIKFATRSKRG